MSRPFTLPRLDNLFSLGKQHGNVFWRHDVDFSLSAALKMADFEAMRGISSTYYLFFDGTNPTYTVAEAENCCIQLEQLGHTVGEHVDERNLFWDTSGTPKPIKFWEHREHISFHCPKKTLWKKFPGFKSAYEPKWEGHYFADSNGVFRYGDPEEFLQVYPHEVQINLHPIWWFEADAWKVLSDEEFEAFLHIPKQGYPESAS